MAKQLQQKYELFEELTSSEIDKVLSLATEREYDAGITIVKEGDPAEELLLVEDGKLALQMQLPGTQGNSNRKVTVDFATRGEVLGWSAVVEPYVFTLSGTSLQRVKVLAIDASKLRTLIQNDHQVGYKLLAGIIKVVASRLADTRALLVSERLAATSMM